MDDSFRDLKVGDTIFVVQQQDRWRTENNKPVETSFEIITKVGRKYAYFERGRLEYCFCLDSGVSIHKDNNTRSNGYGFDVFHNLSEYNDKLHQEERFSLLSGRLMKRNGTIIDLDPVAVEAIHEILDEIENR
tara:strand:- start:6823 stop:7221 length:399 start_codon:yes stop_codon:yes gene_type:complete